MSLVPQAPPKAPTLHRVPLVGSDGSDGDASFGSLVAEEWSAQPRLKDGGRAFELTGSSRVFLAADDEGLAVSQVRSGREITYRKLHLLDQSLSFDLDLSFLDFKTARVRWSNIIFDVENFNL